MREILFRGKSKEIGYWVEGNYCFCGVPLMGIMDIPSIQTVSGDDFRYIAVSPETVGQFTGLTDKNGKKIFEWDIVKLGDIIWLIEYDVKCAKFVMKTYTEIGVRSFDIILSERCEVIGNKFDNPELKKRWTK